MLQEAHNLDSDCRDCASIELSLAMLDSHLQKLDEFKKALQKYISEFREGIFMLLGWKVEMQGARAFRVANPAGAD